MTVSVPTYGNPLASFTFHRVGIHVGPIHHDRPLAILKDPHHSGPADTGLDVIPERSEFLFADARRTDLNESEFWLRTDLRRDHISAHPAPGVGCSTQADRTGMGELSKYPDCDATKPGECEMTSSTRD